MHKILVMGAGKIGSLIATLLHDCGEYLVFLADIDAEAVKRVGGDLGLPAPMTRQGGAGGAAMVYRGMGT